MWLRLDVYADNVKTRALIPLGRAARATKQIENPWPHGFLSSTKQSGQVDTSGRRQCQSCGHSHGFSQ